MYTDVDRMVRITKNINACGLSKLRKYCTTKPHPVKDFDRDIAVIRCAIKYGTTYTGYKFSMTYQRADAILTRYEKYAIACLRA